MENTNHLASTRPTTGAERPSCLPYLSEKDFVKAKYSHGDKRCYTARMLDVFLSGDHPYVAAYKEFRLATMDYLYRNHGDDHAATAKDRAKCWNEVGRSLGYEMINVNMVPWCDGNKTEKPDLNKAKTAIALLSSMVSSGEDHSETSREAVRLGLASLES